MLPLRRLTRVSLSSPLVRSLTAAPRAAPFFSRYIRPVSTMDIVFTKDAAPPAGPYSHAIKTPTAIYCSGQIHFDLEGNLIQGTIQEKTAACIRNLKAVLVAAGSDINKVVKVNIFLNDMNDFAAMNEEYSKWFTHKPARSCVAVKTLPKNADVEIEAIALP